MCRVCSAASTCCCCLRLFCSLLHDCMWHVWLMRHYPKVSQANNFRQQGEAKKKLKGKQNYNVVPTKTPASFMEKLRRRQHGLMVHCFELAEVVKISLILLLPCSVLDCVLVSLFTCVCMSACLYVCLCLCVYLSLMKRLACRAAPYCLQHMQSQAQPCPALA